MAAITSRFVEGCVFRFDDNRAKFLLLRRGVGAQPFPGMWQFVTATVLEDEKAVDAFVREVGEETGLEIVHLWCIPVTISLFDYQTDTLHIHPVFAAQTHSFVDPLISPEHDRFEWLEFSEARDRLVWPAQRHALEIVKDYIIGGSLAMHLTRIER